MPRLTCPVAAFLAALAATAAASEFRTLEAATLQSWLRTGRTVAVVDLQPPQEFRDHHFEGAIPAADSLEKLDRLAGRFSRSKSDVVVVSRDGGEEALRAARRLVLRGVAGERIMLLAGGMAAAVAQAPGCSCCTAPEAVSE